MKVEVLRFTSSMGSLTRESYGTVGMAGYNVVEIHDA